MRKLLCRIIREKVKMDIEFTLNTQMRKVAVNRQSKRKLPTFNPHYAAAAKQLFCSSVARQTLILRHVHAVSSTVCPLPAGKTDFFAGGVVMRADPSVSLQKFFA